MRRVGVILVVPFALAGCHGASNDTEGSGVLATEQRDVADFKRVELAGTAKVNARVGRPSRVTVRGDDNLLDRLKTDVTGDKLVVSETGSFDTHKGLTVDVTAPSLEGVAVSGTGELVASGVRADRFRVDLSGIGSLTASGTANRVDAVLEGTGELRLGQLNAPETRVEVAGTGGASVYATEFLEATVTGTGSITYGGDPVRIRKRIKGAGSVTPR